MSQIEFVRIYDNFSVGVRSVDGEAGTTSICLTTSVTGAGTGNKIQVEYELAIPHSSISENDLIHVLRWVSDTLRKKTRKRENQRMMDDAEFVKGGLTP